MEVLSTVRSFYLDIAEWANDEPARWGPWAVPSPVRYIEISHKKTVDHRKSRMDQRTRERLPVLPALVAAADAERHTAAERLRTALTTPPGELFDTGGQILRRTRTSANAPMPGYGQQTPSPPRAGTSPSKNTGRFGPGPPSRFCATPASASRSSVSSPTTT